MYSLNIPSDLLLRPATRKLRRFIDAVSFAGFSFDLSRTSGREIAGYVCALEPGLDPAFVEDELRKLYVLNSFVFDRSEVH